MSSGKEHLNSTKTVLQDESSVDLAFQYQGSCRIPVMASTLGSPAGNRNVKLSKCHSHILLSTNNDDLSCSHTIITICYYEKPVNIIVRQQNKLISDLEIPLSIISNSLHILSCVRILTIIISSIKIFQNHFSFKFNNYKYYASRFP